MTGWKSTYIQNIQLSRFYDVLMWKSAAVSQSKSRIFNENPLTNLSKHVKSYCSKLHDKNSAAVYLHVSMWTAGSGLEFVAGWVIQKTKADIFQSFNLLKAK